MRHEPYAVLLVDDEYLIRELLKNVVPWKREGFAVMAEASSAEEALTIMESRSFDMVLADICLPCMDGIDFSGIVRERYPDTPVLILSGHDSSEYARRSIRSGVWDYILKPIVADEICAALQRVRKRIEARGLNAIEDEDIGGLAAGSASRWGVLEEIRAWVHDHLSDPKLTLSRTASDFLLNASYLSRRFKQAFGVSFTDYVMNQRIRVAMDLARNTLLPAGEVSERVGISDPHYFSIVFKKYCGKTFTQCRNG